MSGSQYYCWGCGLMQGEPDDPEEASKLCPSCQRAEDLARSPRPLPEAD